MVVHKIIHTDVTRIEISMIARAFEMFKPEYEDKKDPKYYIKKYGKKKGYDELNKAWDAIKPAEYKGIKEWFETLERVNYSVYLVKEGTTKIRLGDKSTQVLIDVLMDFKINYEFCDDSEKRDRDRKIDFLIKFYKEDIDRLLKGLLEIQATLKSSWVERIEYIP